MAKADLTHDAADVIHRKVENEVDEWGRTPYLSLEQLGKTTDIFCFDAICKWILENQYKKVRRKIDIC